MISTYMFRILSDLSFLRVFHDVLHGFQTCSLQHLVKFGSLNIVICWYLMVRKNSLLVQGYPCFHHVFLGVRHVRMIRGLRYRTFGLTYLQTHVSPSLTKPRKAPFQRIKPTKSSRKCWRLQHCCTENTYNICVGI